MAHTPLKMTIDEAHAEVNYGWSHAYGPEAIAQAVDSLDDQPLGYRVNIFIARRVLPRNLLPHARPLRLVESNLRKSRDHLQTLAPGLRVLVELENQTPAHARHQRRRLGARSAPA